MPRFFCDNILESIAIISGDEAHHISKSLRMKIGQQLTICDTNGYDYNCEIVKIDDNITLNIKKKIKNNSEPSIKITLYQALPKNDKLDFIVQKSIELGVFKIVPIQTEFCVSKSTNKDFSKKLSRLNKISLESAKQSGRGIIPEVCNILTFEDALKNLKTENAIIFYEGGGYNLNDLVSPNLHEISIFIGSEGGFSKDEINLSKSYNVKLSTLGKLILRCETAPIVANTLILNITNNI